MTNSHPIGPPVPGWSPRSAPPVTPISGRYVRLEHLDPSRHLGSLMAAHAATDPAHWTYLSDEKPRSEAEWAAWAQRAASTEDPLFHAVVDATSGDACGVAAYLRIDRSNGVIEIGHINFAPRLQRSRGATEAIYLLARRAIDELGYRRLEWKCDSLNAPSRAAALRFGFTFEGVFRQAIVYKGRNRDTAWYSIIDREWPALKRRFESWLDPDNFDAAKRQRRRLQDCG